MIRMYGIALMIVGLIVQPLMAAMPVCETSLSMSVHHSVLNVDRSDQVTTRGDEPSQAPCHDIAADQVAPMPCNDCDSDCANGACASASSLSALAVIIPSLLKFERLSAVRVNSASGELVHGLPSRIFHPPKHA
jgi:hypothetical protein